MAQIADYNILKCIGKGSFARVYLAEHKTKGERCAIKITQKNKEIKGINIVELAENEIEIMRVLKHPSILELLDYSSSEILSSPAGQTKEVAFLALELAENGELFDWIFQTGRLTEEMARFYFLQLLDALSHMHEKGIYHSDIKLSNVLLDKDYNLKLSDFGLSSYKATSKTVKGSGEYMAPEFFQGKSHNNASVDLFAVGVMLFGMVFGRMPFYKAMTADSYYKTIAANRLDLFWKIHISKSKKEFIPSDSFMDLISSMLSYFPFERPSLAEIREHEWCKGEVATLKEVAYEFNSRITHQKEAAMNNKNDKFCPSTTFDDFQNTSIHRGISEKEEDWDIEDGLGLVSDCSKVTSFCSTSEVETLLLLCGDFSNSAGASCEINKEKCTAKLTTIAKGKLEQKAEIFIKIQRNEEEEKSLLEALCLSGDKVLFNKTFGLLKEYFLGHVNSS